MLAELAAAEIAKIAFEAVIGKLTEGAMDKGVELWQKIKQKLQKELAAAQVLAAAEQTKSEAMIEQQVVPFLQVEMLKDPNFPQEIRFFGFCYAMDGGYKGWNPYIERHLAIFVNYF